MEIFNDSLKDYYAKVYKPHEPNLFEVDQWDEKLKEDDGSLRCWCRDLIYSWRLHNYPDYPHPYQHPYLQLIGPDYIIYDNDDPVDFYIIGYNLCELPGNNFILTEVPDIQDVDRERWDELCETFPNLRRQTSPTTIVISVMIDNGW